MSSRVATNAHTKVASISSSMKYLSIPHREPLWVDPSLTSSQYFSPQELAPLYPPTHATEDIIFLNTVHMLLSPSITSSIFLKQSTPTLHNIMGLYLDISSRTHQWQFESPLWIPIHISNLQNKYSPLSPPYTLDLKLGLKFHHSNKNSINVWESYRFMLVQYQCMKAMWRVMDLGDTNYKFMDLGMNFQSSWT